MKKLLVLLSLLILAACENRDYRDGKKALEDGSIDNAIFYLSKVPSDDKKYNESLAIMNEYFQSNIEIRKRLLSKKDDRFRSSHPTISDTRLSSNLDDFSSQLLMDKLSSIMMKKNKNGDYFYKNYPTLVFTDDVYRWTNMDGANRELMGGMFARSGARTTLIFKNNGKGEIVMQHGASEKRANLEWTINLYNIEFNIGHPEKKVGTFGNWTKYPSNFSDHFKNNRGEIKVDRLININNITQKDRQEFYNFAEKIKDDFIKYITPINISEWNSSPLWNSGDPR